MAGDSLIERTQRYLGQQVSALELKLGPLIEQLQAHGWFSGQTLRELDLLAHDLPTDETRLAIKRLLRNSLGVATLAQGSDLDELALELMHASVRPATVLLLWTSRTALDRLGGLKARPAQADLRELGYTRRHLEDLAPYAAAGFKKYLTLAQMHDDLKRLKATAMSELFEVARPLTVADLRSAQGELKAALAATVGSERDLARGSVVRRFRERLRSLPAPLWGEIEHRLPGPAELVAVIEPGEASDFDLALGLVSLFPTTGEQGARLHALFAAVFRLERFITGGFIPDTVGRADEP